MWSQSFSACSMTWVEKRIVLPRALKLGDQVLEQPLVDRIEAGERLVEDQRSRARGARCRRAGSSAASPSRAPRPSPWPTLRARPARATRAIRFGRARRSTPCSSARKSRWSRPSSCGRGRAPRAGSRFAAGPPAARARPKKSTSPQSGARMSMIMRMRGRLAGAVRAEQAEDGSRRHREGDAVDGHEVTEGLAHLAQFEIVAHARLLMDFRSANGAYATVGVRAAGRFRFFRPRSARIDRRRKILAKETAR